MAQEIKNWWIFLLMGIILLVLGIYIFGHPIDALVSLALYIGISLLVTGIFQVALSLSTRKTSENWGWRLAMGIIDILFALVLLSSPGITAAVLPFVVGFWTMVFGTMMIADAFQVKKSGESVWWLGVLGGILTILLGYFIASNLMAGTITITFWMGFGFLVAGIINISKSFRLKKLGS